MAPQNVTATGVVGLVIVVLASLPAVVVAQASTCNTRYLLSGPSPSPVLTVDAINGILTEHNNARRTVSPMASRMPMLTWNQTLANFAQEYMDGCPGMTHSTNAMRSNSSRFGYSYIGENLAAGTSSMAFGAANGGASSTRLWNDEMADWTYPMTCRTGAVCGHYTQVIWANTLEVGCGYRNCPSQPLRNYWSCVYGPGGNYARQNPYPVASSASDAAECQSTTGGLPGAPGAGAGAGGGGGAGGGASSNGEGGCKAGCVGLYLAVILSFVVVMALLGLLAWWLRRPATVPAESSGDVVVVTTTSTAKAEPANPVGGCYSPSRGAAGNSSSRREVRTYETSSRSVSTTRGGRPY